MREAKTNRQTFNGVIFRLLHFQQQLHRSNMSLWHKRTPSGSGSLCLNCNRYPSGAGVLPHMGYIGMCRCEGYGFQAVYSRIGYINQSVWV